MEDIVLFENKKNCCGCKACITACPKQAIHIEIDENGFSYPKIDRNKCIQCGKCIKTCSYGKNLKGRENMDSFVAVTKDDNILKASASGGVFATIAKNIIENGGVVFGSSMQNIEGKLLAKHILVDKLSDLVKIQGSKYVQSEIGNSYLEAKKCLETGRLVLFSGTPCQIAGLKGYLKKKYDNLFTIDIICHGVPETKFLQDYIAYIEKGHKIKITNLVFRDKTNGWGLCGRIDYLTRDGKSKSMKLFNNESSYYYFFQKGFVYRINCYTCPYANEKRPADITIGDYWGIQREHSEILEKVDVSKGISCLIINNKQGEQLIEKFSSHLELYKSSFEKIQRNNSQLMNPTKYNPVREKILEDYKKNGYKAVEKQFKKMIGIKLYGIKIRNRIPKSVKKFVRKKDK